MNEKCYQIAASHSSEDLTKNAGAFFSSVFLTLNHIMLADQFWCKRFAASQSGADDFAQYRDMSFTSYPDQVCFEDLSAMQAKREAMDKQIIAWTESIDANDFLTPLTYKDSQGEQKQFPLAMCMQHFFNHQTHHRGQLTTLYSQMDLDIGITDLPYFYEHHFQKATKRFTT